ncbi:MAG TPA: hypothetical protein VHW66_11345 [Stellaceae bacterium]|jgi:uncharacterized membrane protein|nr:hypothetical protein [Stellaceae bacterium]
MKGNILGFDRDTNTGAISGHDGQRYDFVRLEWRAPSEPGRGAVVDFVAEGSRATQIYPVGLYGNPTEGETANIVYILYLVGIVVGITGIVGLVMAYVNKPDAPEWVQAHYRYQIRTFWIGLLYGVIGLVLAVVLIGFFVWLFALVWLIVRCVKGMQAITRGEPPQSVTTWLW